jgi:hypothetical protein
MPIPAGFEVQHQVGECIFSFANNHIISIPGDLAVAGSRMGPADNGDTIRVSDLIPECRFIDGIEGVAGHIVFRAIHPVETDAFPITRGR